MITISRAVQTSIACPSQWDAWDADGNYYYLRYRHGWGRIERYPGGPNFWERLDEEPETIGHFEDDIPDGEPDGFITLEEFAERAGVQLCPNLDHKNFNEYLADALKTTLQETYGGEEGVQL